MSKVPGRLHATAGVLFILCGIAHSIGQFSATGASAPVTELERSMKATLIPDTPFTYWNVMQCWGALYGAMTILFGVLLLASASASGGDPRVRRAGAITGALAAIAQTVGSFVFHAIPPVFFMIPAALLLLFVASRREPAPA